MFDALARLSSRVPEAYERASEFGDLRVGNLHLIQLDDEESNMPQWVALSVVQSYNPRRKVPRSGISISDLESCLSKASSVSAQNSAVRTFGRPYEKMGGWGKSLHGLSET
ncbi:hypothetical protein KSS87_001453, partial [Heliosperma pusillum]